MSLLPSLARFERDEAIAPPTLVHRITTSMFVAVAVGMVANLLLKRDFLEHDTLWDVLGVVFFFVGYAVCLAVGAWRVRPRFDSLVLFAIPYTVLWLQALAGLSMMTIRLVTHFAPPDPQLARVDDFLGGVGVAAYALSPMLGVAFLILARRSGVLFFGEVFLVLVPFMISPFLR